MCIRDRTGAQVPAPEMDSGVSGLLPGVSFWLPDGSDLLDDVKVYNFVPVVGINHNFDTSAWAGSWLTICLWNWGQSPPEMTATWATARRSASASPMDGRSACLLSARVPSRSKATRVIIVDMGNGRKAWKRN